MENRIIDLYVSIGSEKMLDFEWINGNNKVISVYWSEFVTLKMIMEKYSRYDIVEFWYPTKLSDDIYNEWKEVLSYIHYKQNWGDESVTRCISLSLDNEEILSGFAKNTRYEVRRAINSDNLLFFYSLEVTDKEMLDFEKYYNQFAESKNLHYLCYEKINGMRKNNNFVITKILNEKKEILAMHSYLYNPFDRVELYTSCSVYRYEEDNSVLNLIGRANRLLHYKDMLLFKNLGIKKYDFGGNYLGKENRELEQITYFKEKFGGYLEYSDASITIPIRELVVIDKIIAYLPNIKKNLILFGCNNFGYYFLKKCKQERIIVSTLIDNFITQEIENQKIYTDTILDNIDAKNTLIISMLSISAYKKLAVKFKQWGYYEGENLVNCRCI